ncbi:MAG TPA: replicative DNA helicase [Longimicrobiales bacterium]|nr:replicative DNA helicase [Longimicrobiales bacterium]
MPENQLMQNVRMSSRGNAVASIPFVDRPAPYAAEAEVSVLGGMLIDNDAVAKALEILSDDGMFYREGHRRIFRSMTRLFQKGAVVDPVTLSEELTQTGELEGIGGVQYLAELMDAVPTAANVEYHAKIVRERALLRRLIEAATQIVQDGYDVGERSVDELLDLAEQRIFQVAQSHDRQGFVWLKQILYSTFERIEQLQAAKGGVTGVPTGFTDLDRKTGGWQKGDLVIIASRPSMGKTAFVVGSALQSAIVHRVPVAIFSLEMSKESLVQRMLCHEALVDLSRLLRGRLSDDDYTRLAQAAGHLNTAPIWIDDSGMMGPLELRAKARRLKADQPELGLIIVDYLQLMESSGNHESRQQEVSQISRSLKGLAKELQVPILALSQLSRAPEQRSDHRPQLSDLRESGSLEQDADVVAFLYRPEYYMNEMEAEEQGLRGRAELIIGKQRNGPTGMVELYFRHEFTRFESVTRVEQPQYAEANY